MSTLRSPLRRRTVLAGGTAAGAGAAALVATTPAGAAPSAAGPGGTAYFRHGVASGDPEPDRVVIWTRVTPTAASTPGSGKGPKIDVGWEVSRDRSFSSTVRRGTFATSASRDHTVKLDVGGLKPATWYFYRFRYRGSVSRVGRMRTAPAAGSSPGHLRFGVVSCANLQAGWFTAYRGLAKRDDLHAVLHLGDYLYEYGPGQYGYGSDNVDIRKHQPAHEMVSLADYRQRHAQYKRDADLQDLHAKYPWIITWDDHEVTNDQWEAGAENHTAGGGQGGEGNYLQRRARAHRAYDEWMPVRMDATAALGDGARLYRRLTFGTLAEISMLDLRTYRDEQVRTAAPTPVPALEAEVSDPDRTLLGRRQMRWLKESLSRQRPQWKIIGNPVMIAPVTFAAVPQDLLTPINDVTGLLPDDGLPYNVDQWDGYTDDRREVLAHIRDHQIKDALFVTGDIHSGWACELPYDVGADPVVGDSAGVEFVCSSVTSNNLKDITGTPSRTTSVAVEQVIMANNQHIKYLNFDDHGFSVLDVTAKRAQMDWFIIGDRADKQTTVRHTASFATRTGTGKVISVDRPVR
ncbi:phosphodiesterase/alkaline phosphatase D [Nocardioides psychrotolerans]|uniref:Alkaline phosphatase D n=1 Tax=Nocardioides psychrotolerans TaxID=1005945 RepID=A0A1I3HEP1_9ACTN|nr:alkaline phosphatase D family protein [Nocardioides psychrotolerans]GEP37634.1 phosphodiesterase/alkaline phosphatase D [Nocardioides psychrotolerans]SFI34079.1 alkaline phosphatase D [Nocardioides psychrotolerans]